ncbi:MAG: hypothetical protein NTY38_13580, partial [Acidobacteria bacterium]|nr:hypothetical protein [Acidobacteriota bacterium]
MFALLPAVGLFADGYTIRTFAGSSTSGDGGAATAALIGDAAGIACDLQGNWYIADALDHRVRKITPAGVIHTYAGTSVGGFSGDGGPATQAQLSYPYGVAVDANGDLYIADLGNARIRKVTPGGIITTFAGGGSFEGEGAPASESALRAPRNVAVSGDGTLYISDFSSHRVLSVAADGALRYVAGNGAAGAAGDTGSPTSAQLRNPAGIAFDPSGWLYIADSGNKRIRRVANGRISTVAATGTALTMYTPTDVAVDGAGNLYIADGRSDETLRIAPTGVVGSIRAGSRSLAINSAGEVLLGLGMVVHRYSAGAISVAAGTGHFTFGGDGGPAKDARLSQPVGVAVDATGVTYLADTANHRVRRVSLDGRISTVAGTGARGFSGDGKAAMAAQLDSPASVAVDGTYNLYILDSGNQRIRKVTPGGVISTLAGTGLRGYAGDRGPAVFAELDSPAAIAVDAAGLLYIADTGNHRIRRIDAAGVIETVAGNGVRGDAGDGGQAGQAALNAPRGVAADGAGNVYIADTGNRRIRRVNASGVMEAAGTAQWSFPTGLTVAPDGSLLVTDGGIQRIRRVEASGSTGSIGGSGRTGNSGDDGAALQAALNGPSAIAVTLAGDILFTDTGNDRVRVLTLGAIAAPISDEVRLVSIVNAASLLEGPVAPGELVEITAAGLAERPALTFDDLPAPVLSQKGEQITAQVPYELAGRKSALLRITQGAATPLEMLVVVADSAPGIYAESG